MWCNFICSAVTSDLKNLKTNSDPLFEVMCEGTPCLENICWMNKWASLGASIDL